MIVKILRETGIELADGTRRNSVLGEVVEVPARLGAWMCSKKSAVEVEPDTPAKTKPPEQRIKTRGRPKSDVSGE